MTSSEFKVCVFVIDQYDLKGGEQRMERWISDMSSQGYEFFQIDSQIVGNGMQISLYYTILMVQYNNDGEP